MTILNLLVITFVAGILGPLIGGLLAIKGNKDDISLAMMLALSLGMMLAMVSFDLIPESLEGLNIYCVVAIILVCVAIMLIMDDKLHHHHHLIQESSQDLHHHDEVFDHVQNKTYIELALMMIVSVGLHNFPEGLAIGSSMLHTFYSGLFMAILLMLHNIPEGMGMMIGLLKGNVPKVKALSIVICSGIPTILGGLIGVIFGNLNEAFISIFLSIACGCMLYVIFFELIPQIHLLANRKKVILCELLGFLLGFVLINGMHVH